MTEAMPFLQKAILLSYDPRPFARGGFFVRKVRRNPQFARETHRPLRGFRKFSAAFLPPLTRGWRVQLD